MLAAEAAAAVNLAVSPEAKGNGADHPTQVQPPPKRSDSEVPNRLAETEADRTTAQPAPGADDVAEPHDHHLLIDAHEDRWAWRRKIRQSPRKLFFYRICVALLGPVADRSWRP